MPTTKMTHLESVRDKPAGFDSKTGEPAIEGAPPPIENSAIGQQAMNAAHSAMPKVTNYPY